MNRYMQIAAAASRQSDYKKQVGAVIVRGGSVLGIGYNREGSCRRTPTAWSRHAETSAVISAGGDIRGCTIFVYRGRLGPRLAKPCLSCQVLLRSSGVKRVYYSVPDGMERMRL